MSKLVNRYCSDCNLPRDNWGMEMMAQGHDRMELARLAIEEYKSENFSIVYRGHNDHTYELLICRHAADEEPKDVVLLQRIDDERSD